MAHNTLIVQPGSAVLTVVMFGLKCCNFCSWTIQPGSAVLTVVSADILVLSAVIFFLEKFEKIKNNKIRIISNFYEDISSWVCH
jgi:hypothetical protein